MHYTALIILHVLLKNRMLSSCAEQFATFQDSNTIFVTIGDGVLEGKVVQNEYGGIYYSFQGIPYAEPPVGDLRFKAPKPKKPWHGVRDAKESAPICPQRDLFSSETIGNEDCLYLNVNTPDLHPAKPLSVMFLIHGGGFNYGSGNLDFYGPEFLVREDVILVTINYRLAALGFLSLGTKDIPGNAGMKDQVAALRWVRRHIKQFGGDPDNVTIFGESAGGTSASFHLLSPMSRGLFKRVIAQSGVSTCWWTNNYLPQERAIILAKKLGFYSENSDDLYKFFKTQPVENLTSTSLPLTFAEASKRSFQLAYGVIDEKQFGDDERFFYGDIFDNIRFNELNNTEIMMGYNEDEGYIDFIANDDINKKFEQANQNLEFFVPQPIVINRILKEQLEVGNLIKKFYFKDNAISMRHLNQLVNYLSSNIFVFWIIELAKTYAKNKYNRVYVYKFTAKTERNIGARMFKLNETIGNKEVATHLDELAYLFPIKSMNPKLDMNSNVFKFTETVVKLWTNFAKYGNPTPDKQLEVDWKPYTADKQDYLEIGTNILGKRSPDLKQITFLENIYKMYYPQCLTSDL